jgi:hypothetical protein
LGTKLALRAVVVTPICVQSSVGQHDYLVDAIHESLTGKCTRDAAISLLPER